MPMMIDWLIANCTIEICSDRSGGRPCRPAIPQTDENILDEFLGSIMRSRQPECKSAEAGIVGSEKGLKGGLVAISDFTGPFLIPGVCRRRQRAV